MIREGVSHEEGQRRVVCVVYYLGVWGYHVRYVCICVAIAFTIAFQWRVVGFGARSSCFVVREKEG